MFSLLLALTLYLTFAPVKPGLSVSQIVPPIQATLPLADKVPMPAGPVKKDADRLGVVTTARSALVSDWETGSVLYEKNADQPQAIASITKLMTALVTLDTNPNWDATVQVLPTDEPPGGVPYLIPGEHVTVRDLFNLSLVASSNGATNALARSTGMTMDQFVAKMNEKASALGMSNAAFKEPVGLDADNAASARDVSRLVRAALARQEIHDAVVQPSYEIIPKEGRARTVQSTDELLGSFIDKAPYTFLGGKTGYIQEAGYCFGAAAKNGEGHGVIAVVLGADTKEQRFKEVKSLMYWAFDAYAWPRTLSEK